MGQVPAGRLFVSPRGEIIHTKADLAIKLLGMMKSLGVLRAFWWFHKRKNPYQGHDPRVLDLIYLLRPVFGNPPIYRLIQEMLDDRLLCMKVKFSARDIEQGHTRRKDRLFNPIGEKSIGDYGRWMPAGVNRARLREVVKVIGQQGELSSKVLSMDCSFIDAYGTKMENTGTGYEGTFGYKIGVIHQAEKGREYILAARIHPANRSEKKVAPDLIEDLALTIRTKGKLMLVDKGFWSEEQFKHWKEKHGLSVLTPVKEGTLIKRLAVNRVGRKRFFRIERAPRLIVARLRMRDHKSGIFDVIAVQDQDANREAKRKRMAWQYYLTTDRSMSPMMVYRQYTRRWLIENQVFKKMKWDELHLTPLNSGNWNFINLHVYSTLIMRNVQLLYSQRTGTPMDEIIRIIGAKKSEAYFRLYGNRIERLPDDEVRRKGITQWIGPSA